MGCQLFLLLSVCALLEAVTLCEISRRKLEADNTATSEKKQQKEAWLLERLRKPSKEFFATLDADRGAKVAFARLQGEGRKALGSFCGRGERARL
jgi:hypothetical protein